NRGSLTGQDDRPYFASMYNDGMIRQLVGVTLLMFLSMTQLTQSATVTREGYATANTDTNRISLKARLIKGLLALTGARHRLEKAVGHGRFSSEAAPLPGRMTRRYPVHVDTVEGRTCWTIDDISQTKQVVLYIHGGGYITNITSYDWK